MSLFRCKPILPAVLLWLALAVATELAASSALAAAAGGAASTAGAAGTATTAAGADVRWMRVTFYCPCAKCCGEHACGLTATGRAAAGNIVAVDPRHIPLGRMVRVPEFGWMLAADTGGAIKGRHRLDVLRPRHDEARRLGARWLRVEIVSPREYQRRLEAAWFQLRFDELVREGARLAASPPLFTGARFGGAVSPPPSRVPEARPVILP